MMSFNVLNYGFIWLCKLSEIRIKLFTDIFQEYTPIAVKFAYDVQEVTDVIGMFCDDIVEINAYDYNVTESL